MRGSGPDGLVLGGQKPWVMATVFDLPLEAIRVPFTAGIARFIRGGS